MNWTWQVTTPPASEPVSLADMKEHLKVDVSDDDALITLQIVAARRWAELFCNRSIPSQTLTATLDLFPSGDRCFILPQSPVISVTSIQYIDSVGDLQTLNSSLYTVDTNSIPARIEPVYGTSWPSTRTQLNAVTIVYVAGQSTVDDDIVHAIKLLVGSLYLARENDCPVQIYQPSFSVKVLLAHHRLFYRGPW